jgi:hypothetical protein
MPRAFPTTNHSGNIRNFVIILSLAAGALGFIPVGNPFHSGLFGPAVAEAQNFGQRIIQGKVIGEGDSPVGGATVFLKNLKTRDVKSFSSIPDGSFRFAQVGMVDDYEVWAEKDKKKSSVKSISSFDSRKLVEFDLKLK